MDVSKADFLPSGTVEQTSMEALHPEYEFDCTTFQWGDAVAQAKFQATYNQHLKSGWHEYHKDLIAMPVNQRPGMAAGSAVVSFLHILVIYWRRAKSGPRAD